MGSYFSRSSPESAEVETQNPQAFRYPPKSGTYFGTHFIMGGERFETPQPEQYLFGDNYDLNFLGSKPVPFPYPAPQSSEPTKTLKALVNIRKETVKFVKTQAQIESHQGQGDPLTSPPINYSYHVEFTFDCDSPCEISIQYFCTEEVTPSGLVYKSRDPKISAPPLKFKAGANQVYTNTVHSFSPAAFPEIELQYDPEREVFPVVITLLCLEGDEPRQSHVTTAYVDRYSDGTYALKPLKQKLFVDGLCYLLQEIYGIENKNASRKFQEDEEYAENAAECVICMSDSRDTLILPCRHLCLCHACADSLRYQANNCPICRAPFRALLQIRAVYRIPPAPLEYSPLPPEMPVIQMNSIPGYEMVPLLEALNGPYPPSDLTLAASSVARALNPPTLPEEGGTGDSLPLEPTSEGIMMVASEGEKSSERGDNKDKEVQAVIRRKKSVGSGKRKSVSICEEDFTESATELPDLTEFESSLMDKAEGGGKKVEILQLESVESSPVHGSSVLMIAAIDEDGEFSDEEDTSRARQRQPESSSSRSTPQKEKLKLSEFGAVGGKPKRGGETSASLPASPKSSSATSGPGPVSATQSRLVSSARSSGDSFGSSGSTRLLLQAKDKGCKEQDQHYV